MQLHEILQPLKHPRLFKAERSFLELAGQYGQFSRWQCPFSINEQQPSGS